MDHDTLEEKLRLASNAMETSTMMHIFRDYLDAANRRDEVAKETVKFLRKETRFRNAWVFLAQKDETPDRRSTNAYALVAGPARDTPYGVPKIYTGENVIGGTAERKAPTLIEDLEAMPPGSHYPVILKGKRHRAELAVPVVYGTEVPAVISVTDETPGVFTEKDMQFLKEMALILQGKFKGVRTNEMSRKAPIFNESMAEWMIPYEIGYALEHGLDLTIAKIDIDKFKLVNDAYSHAAGDVLIQYVGSTLDAHSRGADTAFHEHGDEFTMLIKATKEAEANAVMARQSQVLSSIDILSILRPHHLERPRQGEPYAPTQLTVSYGCCSLESVCDKTGAPIPRSALKDLDVHETFRLMAKTADDRMQEGKPKRQYDR